MNLHFIFTFNAEYNSDSLSKGSLICCFNNCNLRTVALSDFKKKAATVVIGRWG